MQVVDDQVAVAVLRRRDPRVRLRTTATSSASPGSCGCRCRRCSRTSTRSPASEAGGGSKASRPERSDHSASGAKPRCSTWTARAACWTSTSLRSRSSGPAWPSRAGTATPSSTNPPAPSRGASRSGTGPRPNTGARGSQAKRPSSRTGQGALPQGGHAEHERVAVPASEGARRRGLRHLRLPRGPGGAAGLDEPAAGLPYRGQRLAGAASEVFLHLLKARRDPPGSR